MSAPASPPSATDSARRWPDPATAFTVVAIAEAISWLALLIGMLFKYSLTENPIGVKIFGPIHGTIFLCYVVVALLVRRPLRWSTATTLWALFASIPPFGSIIFEQWALRTGRLPKRELAGS